MVIYHFTRRILLIKLMCINNNEIHISNDESVIGCIPFLFLFVFGLYSRYVSVKRKFSFFIPFSPLANNCNPSCKFTVEGIFVIPEKNWNKYNSEEWKGQRQSDKNQMSSLRDTPNYLVCKEGSFN